MGTIVFVDGMDEYTAGQATAMGWSSNFTSMQSGRVSGQAGRFSGGTITSMKTVDADAHYTIGTAWKTNDPATSNFLAIMHDTEANVHCVLDFDAGSFIVKRWPSTSIWSASYSILANIWYYIEWDLLISDTVGTTLVRVNEVNIASEGTGLDTKAGTTAFIGQVGIKTITGRTNDFDDLVITKGGGFQGDVRVITTLPTGDGANTAWSASSGADYTCVDESPGYNSDTDYIASASSGDRDTFTFAALGVTGSVKAVAINQVSRKTDTGTRKVVSSIRRSSTDYDNATEIALSTSYAGYQQIYTQDPSTSLAWDVAGADAGEFGVKVST